MKLLVAVDGSEEAEVALAYATDVAAAMDGQLTVVHAVDPSVYDEGGTQPISSITDAEHRLLVESLEDAEERGFDVLEDARRFADELGCEVETELLYGDPVEEVTAYADREEFDTIFVGHRGRSEQAERVLGSVAKDVVERATVPVTVVR